MQTNLERIYERIYQNSSFSILKARKISKTDRNLSNLVGPCTAAGVTATATQDISHAMLHKSLRELLESEHQIFIAFQWLDIEKFQRWINACSRKNFTAKKIT